MSSAHVDGRQDLLERELAALSEEVLALEREHRGDIDRLSRQIEELRRSLAEHGRQLAHRTPGFDDRLPRETGIDTGGGSCRNP